MLNLIAEIARLMAQFFKTRTALHIEILALRHQLCVLQRSVKRLRIRPADRVLWSLLSRVWSDWKNALIFVKPETVIRWQHKRFREHWTRLCRQGESGRPVISKEVQELIRTMSRMNPTWGSPLIVGELAKIGIVVAKSTVEKYMVRTKKSPSQTWRSFLTNHAREIVSIDFMVVPTARFTMLYVLVFLSITRVSRWSPVQIVPFYLDTFLSPRAVAADCRSTGCGPFPVSP